jgi:hypothetical protein
MKTKKALAALAVGAMAMALAACDGRPPDCSDPETLEIVRQIIAQEAQLTNLLQGKSEAEKAELLVITDMRATGYDESIKKYSCAARLTVPFGVGQQVYQMPLRYDSQLDRSGHIAVVDGLLPGDLVGIASALNANLISRSVPTAQAPNLAPTQGEATAPQAQQPAPAGAAEEDSPGNAKPDDYAPAEESPPTTAAPVAAAPVADATTPVSPSFDCAKAGSPAEHLICSDAGLAALDVELAQKYRTARVASTDPAGLKEEQLAWTKNVRDTSADAATMAETYRARIAALSR